MQNSHTRTRAEVLTRLESERWDVLIVGGGIVGAGVARDAAMRGLRVALVEAADFASGTSSRSSRLLHGGIRYLAQGRLGLVREANREKQKLRAIAPHLVEPLPFLFPVYRGRGWPLWQLRVGVKLYDWLSRRGGNFDRSSSLSPHEVQQQLPGLRSEQLVGAVRYFDALTSDARLVLDTLRSAGRHGAELLNYVRFEQAEPQGNLWRARLDDALAGAPLQVTARTIVNAAGPWADRWPQSSTALRLTKGIHLVVPAERLPVPSAVVMTRGERILFVIPWGCHAILGTTDTDYSGDPRDVGVERPDVEYLLDVANEHFPQAGLGPADVTSAWAGLRPLLRGRGRPSEISRSHQIRWSAPGWLDIAGGKLTTYRLMAEQAVDRILAFLGWPAAPCLTDAEPLLPGEHRRPGEDVLPPAVTRSLVEHYCQEEWAMHLGDVMVRRTSWHYALAGREAIAGQVARWMAASLGWSDERRAQEIDDYRRLVEQENRWRG